MATPPTFVAEYEVAWNSSTTPKNISVTTAVSDILVTGGLGENNISTINTPTAGTGLTRTLKQSIIVAGNCTAYLWTAPAVTAETFTQGVGGAASAWWGHNTLRFSGTAGVSASNKTNTTGAPSLGLTTTGDNSAIVVFVADFAAVDGVSRVWRTVNGFTPTSGNGQEVSYFRDSAHYAVYAAYYPDAGAAGSKTVGLSAPTGQTYAIVAVEVLGTASAAYPFAAMTQSPRFY